MAAIFKRGANAIARALLVAIVCTPFVIILLLILYARSPLSTELLLPIRQPIEFDHRHHAGDDGIDCIYCHDTAFRSSFAGIPDTATCAGCHAQIWNQSPMLAPVREAFFNGRPLLWHKVNRLPDYVYFDHSIHVNKGVGCITCHGRVDLMPVVMRAQMLTMSWCVDCHRDPTSHIRPISEVTSMTWLPESDDVGRTYAREYKVQPRINCTTCHR